MNIVLGIELPELIYWNTVFPAQFKFQMNSEFFSVSISHTFIPRGQDIWDIVFFLFCFSFYWSIVDLQHCVNFCCTAKWLSYTYIHILFLYSFPLRLIPGCWILFPMLFSRTLLFIHPICNTLHPSPSLPRDTDILKKYCDLRTSLVVQWFRSHIPMQGM